MLVFILLMGLVWGFVASSIATKKNRDGVGWFFVGFCFGLIGVLIASVASPGRAPGEEQLSAW